jgi:hypothetical protein
MYPTLRNAEIVTCLCEILNHPIQESSLVKAEPDTIRHIYEGLVEKLVGVSREELLTPVQDALETIEYPQLHELSIPEISFEKQLYDMFFNFTPKQKFSIASVWWTEELAAKVEPKN